MAISPGSDDLLSLSLEFSGSGQRQRRDWGAQRHRFERGKGSSYSSAVFLLAFPDLQASGASHTTGCPWTKPRSSRVPAKESPVRQLANQGMMTSWSFPSLLGPGLHLPGTVFSRRNAETPARKTGCVSSEHRKTSKGVQPVGDQ